MTEWLSALEMHILRRVEADYSDRFRQLQQFLLDEQMVNAVHLAEVYRNFACCTW